MWELVCNIFQHKLLLNKLIARRNFGTAKMGESERVLPCINRVCQLAFDINGMGVQVIGVSISMSVLYALPSKYDHFIAILDTLAENKAFTLDFGKSRQHQEEKKCSKSQRFYRKWKRRKKPSSIKLSSDPKNSLCLHTHTHTHTAEGQTTPKIWRPTILSTIGHSA